MEKTTKEVKAKTKKAPKRTVKPPVEKGLAVVVKPGEPAVAREVGLDLKSLQVLIDGYVDSYNGGGGLLVLCDEDARFKGAAVTRPGLPFVGTCVIVAQGTQGNPWQGLSKAQAAQVIRLLDAPRA